MAARCNYSGCVEEWKVALVRARIRKFGFSAHEAQDLEQELILKVRRFHFDEARSNGAKESTVLRTVIDRHLATRTRAGDRGKRHIRKFARLRAGADIADDAVPLRLDVRLALDALPPEERAVCDALGRGESFRQIALALGCSDHKVRHIVERIRRRFHAMGLNGWLED
jgi:RNA polymerase sigma factor (sigma-70 family)